MTQATLEQTASLGMTEAARAHERLNIIEKQMNAFLQEAKAGLTKLYEEHKQLCQKPQ